MTGFLVMDAVAAGTLRDATAGRADRLEPREISSGAHAGGWALPEAVLDDPAFESLDLGGFAVVGLDPGEAWPFQD